MRFNSTSSRIIFYRGDDDNLIVGLTGEVFEVGDKVVFSLKATENATDDIFQVESTNFVSYNDVDNAGCLITIPHENTIDLALATYYYDILIIWANGDYTTIIPPTKFTLAAGGSHDDVS